MRLTTLGTGTVSLAPDRVCAGHLVEAGNVRLLLDAGSGIAHRLAERGIDWWTITHVALTHFHADHHADLPTLLFAWQHARLPGRAQPLGVLGPAGTADLLARLAAAYGEWVTAPGFPLTVQELAPGETVALAEGVALEARQVPHSPESVAYSVRAGSRRLVYTGDTGWDPELAAWAAGCSVLLAECSLPARLAIPSHLTPERCAELAGAARPGHLVLTHFYPPVLDEDIAAIVAAGYEGTVTLAHDGWHMDIEEA